MVRRLACLFLLALPHERASATRLAADVRHLTVDFLPRDYDHPEILEAAAAYIEQRLRASGADVESERYRARGHPCRNVIAHLGPSRGARVIVGAHYDAFSMFGRLPGADDNASGTAGVLELARLLRADHLRRPVELVAFTLEEPPAFGSAQKGSRVHGVYSFNGPSSMGTDASDHASFWRHGFPAIMVTDTAFLRNPHYHGPDDTADSLDYVRMARVVDGVHDALLRLAG